MPNSEQVGSPALAATVPDSISNADAGIKNAFIASSVEG
jgi:hypothetical protein